MLHRFLRLLPSSAFCAVRQSPRSSSIFTASIFLMQLVCRGCPSCPFLHGPSCLCLVFWSLSIISVPAAALMGSFNFRVLHISSRARCVAPALADRHPVHPGVYPNWTISLGPTPNGITSVDLACGFSTLSVMIGSVQLELRPRCDPLTRIAASASHRLSIGNFLNVHALTFPSGPFTMISFVLVATPMNSPYCNLAPFVVFRHVAGTVFSPRTQPFHCVRSFHAPSPSVSCHPDPQRLFGWSFPRGSP